MNYKFKINILIGYSWSACKTFDCLLPNCFRHLNLYRYKLYYRYELLLEYEFIRMSDICCILCVKILYEKSIVGSKLVWVTFCLKNVSHDTSTNYYRHVLCLRVKWCATFIFAAIRDFQEAQKIDGDNRRAQEGLNKANKLLKQSKKRDYYKILGVKR